MPRWMQLGLALILTVFGAAFQTSGAVVRAVLFYSPTCPHCQLVITQSLPPLIATYQDQLRIVAIDTTSAGGHQLYEAAIDALRIPDDRRGVPTLIVGSTVLVGSTEIPTVFPGLIDAGLAAGGIDWPDIPGLREALPAGTDAAMPQADHTSDGLWTRFSRDLFGNGLAAVVLLGTLGAIGWSLRRRTGHSQARRRGGRSAFGVGWRRWAIPVLGLIGVAVSIYMAYVESSGSLAVCGPIGDCNAVQQSEYARLFGLIPIGILGVIGYSLITATHFYRAELTGRAASRVAMALFILTLVGAVFSAYLTFLEIFIIGAVCLWCLSSAVLMTVLLVLAAEDPLLSLARTPLTHSSS
jgi:uncharacterized membrane protein